MADYVHALFVLLSTASYALPAFEGISRGSPFYTLLFLTLGCLSFVLHCEETGICSPLKSPVHARLAEVSEMSSIFLLGVMLLVVFEVRSCELLGRVVAGAWAVMSWFQYPGLVLFNAGVSSALALGVLAFDVWRAKRRFTQTDLRRLALLFVMGLLGAGLFKLLHALWLWHGVWHIYIAGSTYLLLLAQRRKSELARQRAPRAGAASSSHSAALAGHTTPLRRKGGAAAGNAAAGTGATAASIKEEEESGIDGKANVGGVPV